MAIELSKSALGAMLAGSLAIGALGSQALLGTTTPEGNTLVVTSYQAMRDALPLEDGGVHLRVQECAHVYGPDAGLVGSGCFNAEPTENERYFIEQLMTGPAVQRLTTDLNVK